MKLKKYVLIALIFAGLSLNAQRADSKWVVGLGVNFPDFIAPTLSIGDYFTDAHWNHKGFPIRISVGHFISNSFNAEASFNMVKLDTGPFAITDDGFWDFDVNLQYKFANGYILKEDSWFDPYVFVGGEVTNFNGDMYGAAIWGIGSNFWVSNNAALYFQAAYDNVFNGSDYYHYALGFKLGLGKPADGDNDGIADKDDLCPDVWGIEAMEGCPDTDGDGITDAKDNCPELKGLAELAGCPDSDGDGIIDPMDKCPDIAGTVAADGCPDADGDGIVDAKDDCPNAAGPSQFNGCPDSDGDGIVDAKDGCPNQAGPRINNGCPKVDEVAVFNIRKVYFDFNSEKLRSEYKRVLDGVYTILKDHSNINLMLEGHTDNTGEEAYNEGLGLRRSNAVKAYLVNKGLDASRFSVKSYGESQPVGSNDSDIERAKNRRVELKTK